MADHDYIQETPAQRIRNWILFEMLRGAGYAAVVLLGIGATIGVIWIIGQFLPEERLNTPPPMPFSAIETVLPEAQA